MWKNPIDLKLFACLLDLRDRFEKMVKSLWYTNVAFDGKLRQMCEHCICKHSTCFNNFKEAKSNNVAICFAFTNVLRVETKVAEWSKASRYPQWCWFRYFWSPAMLYQRCWCKCSVAVVYRAGQPSRIVLPDSLWQPLNSFIATCIQLRLIFLSSYQKLDKLNKSASPLRKSRNCSSQKSKSTRTVPPLKID